MAQLTWVEDVAIAGTFLPLTGWQYEYVPFGGIITILHKCLLVTMVVTITAGSDTLQERSPVTVVAGAGLIPSEFDVPPVTDEVAAGDRLKILYANGNAAANEASGIISYTPVMG